MRILSYIFVFTNYLLLSLGIFCSLTFTALLHTIPKLHTFWGRRFIVSTSVIMEVPPETIIRAVKQMKKNNVMLFWKTSWLQRPLTI